MNAIQAKKKESISMLGVVIHDVQRFATIANVLRKFGFGNLVQAVKSGISGDFNSSNEILDAFRSQPSCMASNLRSAIEELGTTYIKFGQMLSTRYDLLPKDIIDELAKLQDGSPQIPFETIEAILNEAYGDYHDVFETFDREPLGAASIAQAHAATLKDGSRVVVKVQRPRLLPLIRSDIDILNVIAKTLDNNIEEIAYFNLPSLIQEFERAIVSELNFCNERANIEYFTTRYEDHEMFVFPTPYAEFSRPNILVMREIQGKKITTIEPDTPDAHRMAEALLEIAFDMVFRDGVFHADPHPGNVFATPDHHIGLLDFGLVGHFTARQRSEFTRIVLAVHLGDCAAIARALMTLGHPTKRVVLADLEAEISTILQKYYLSSLQKIDVAAFAADFVSAGQKYAVQIPSEFTNAVRAVINLEGIIQYLNPNLDVVKTLSLFSQKLLSDSISKENFPNLALQAGLAIAEVSQSLPGQFSQLVQDVGRDGIAIRLQEETSAPIVDALNGCITRLTLSLLIVGLLLAVVLFAPHNVVAVNVLVAIALLWMLILCFWHVRARSRRRKLRIHPIIESAKRRSRWF